MKTKVYVAAGVLAMLAGGLWLTQGKTRRDTAAHPGEAARDRPSQARLAKIDAAGIDQATQIRIQDGHGPGFVFEKQSERWTMAEPVNYGANSQYVQLVLDNVRKLRVTELVDDGATQYARYHVEGDGALRVQIFANTRLIFDAFFGEVNARGQVLRLGDAEGVYIVSGFDRSLYTRDARDWREWKIATVDEANVTSVTLTNPSGTFVFSKNAGRWAGTVNGKPIVDLDGEKVSEMVRAYKTISAEDFADPDKTPADTGLDRPATLAFGTSEGVAAKVQVGNIFTGRGRYTQLTGNPTVFLLTSHISDWAVSDVSRFQRTRR